MTDSRNQRKKGLLLSMATLAGGALLMAGAAAPVANAATPTGTANSVIQVKDGQLANTGIGTYLQVVNASDKPITVELSGNYKVHEVLAPGGHVDCKGNGDDDDVSGKITFADGSSQPVYANNPSFAECYTQVGGHKWHGSGGHSIDGKRFHADWNGNWKDPNGDTWKDWRLTFQGRG